MMKATLSSKDEEIKQLFEDKMQKEKLFALEKVEIDKKYNLEMQKLQSQLLFEVKEKADEQDSYRRLLQKQQQQHDASCIIPPTQDCGYLGKSRGVSCSPKKQKSLSSPVKRLSVINKPSSKLSLDSKSAFPNVQSFLQEKPFYNGKLFSHFRIAIIVNYEEEFHIAVSLSYCNFSTIMSYFDSSSLAS